MAEEENKLIEEFFESVQSEFTQHLNLPNNDRIILSGRYGAGKTTFLNHYFGNNGTKYNVVKLAPIDYSIATNEDIFKYIKYDVLYHLFKNDKINFENYDFSQFETISQFLPNNILDVFSAFLPIIPKFGGNVQKVYKSLKELGEKYDEFRKDMNTNHDEQKMIEFISGLNEKEGSLYENNIITQLIQSSLAEIKGENQSNVLVIDDLDRIDPHHIFRLFNVFAAHLNEKEDVHNKFGFDVVIFVCDIENIRNIFRNRYGADVDFNGYIDKFYSKKIFYYDSNDEVESYTRKLIEKINFHITTPAINQQWDRGDFVNELSRIVSKLISINKLNLRQILKETNEFPIKIMEVKFSKIQGLRNIVNWQLSSILIIEFLISLIGEKNSLLEALEAAIDYRETKSQIEKRSLENILTLTECRTHKFSDGSTFDIEYDNSTTLNCLLKSGSRASFSWVDYKVSKTQVPAINPGAVGLNTDEEYNLFALYRDGIKILDDIGYLK